MTRLAAPGWGCRAWHDLRDLVSLPLWLGGLKREWGKAFDSDDLSTDKEGYRRFQATRRPWPVLSPPSRPTRAIATTRKTTRGAADGDHRSPYIDAHLPGRCRPSREGPAPRRVDVAFPQCRVGQPVPTGHRSSRCAGALRLRAGCQLARTDRKGQQP